MINVVLPLDSPDAALNVAGGKGINLKKLYQMNFQVPAGFIITTAVYKAFIRANGLENRIFELVRAVSVENTESLETASHEIQVLFSQFQ